MRANQRVGVTGWMTLLACGWPGVARSAEPGRGLTVTRVLCDSKQDPVGVDPNRVRFSWQMASPERGQVQAGHRVAVATSRERLDAGSFDVWDSAQVGGRQSLLVRYAGQPLLPATRYHWKVRVWDGAGRPSAWSAPASFVTSLRTAEDWAGARWIGYEAMPASERLVPGLHGLEKASRRAALPRPVVPLFRRAFRLDKPVAQALVFISGLGHYELLVNGSKIGDAFLAPGWTDYDKTTLYNTHDVTEMLVRGANVVGAIVGHGFHHVNQERYFKLVIAHGYPRLLCRLRILYADGSTEDISSSPEWKTAPSPITFTSIYGGEDYDARLEQPGWATPSFDDRAWRSAIEVPAPAGRLVPEISDALRVMETLRPVKITDTAGGTRLYDFGQNASGIVRLRVRGRAGQTVTITPAELITPENRPNQKASGGPYVWTYTLRGNGEEVWSPRFTYYGFRYVQVEAAPEAGAPSAERPSVLDLTLLHTRNSAPTRGRFECSYELFNRVDRLIDWAIRSNLASVVTDCPHREKLGWLEQTHLMGEAIHFAYDLAHLYRKQIADMIDAQTASGLIPDIAPEYVEFEGGFRDSPEWGSAGVILPWLVYRWYGDAEPLSGAYSMMKRYVDYLETRAEGHVLSHGLGDWYDLGPRFPGEAQLTPKALTATSIFYNDARLVADAARKLGHMQDAAKYDALAAAIRQAFNARFFDPVTGQYSTGSQTALAMPLCLGLVEEQDRSRVLASLLRTVERDGRALTAGDIGFHYVVRALSEAGAGDLLFAMNARDDVPGYGFQLRKGATALTESWAAIEEVSNNHLMLGHLRAWFFSGLAGIGQAEDSVAYERLVIRPQTIAPLDWVRAEFENPYGRVLSAWKREGPRMTFDVEVPVNAQAEIHLPAAGTVGITESGQDLRRVAGLRVVREADGLVVLAVGSGRYRFDVPSSPGVAGQHVSGSSR